MELSRDHRIDGTARHVSPSHAPGEVVKIEISFFMESLASDQIDI